MVKISVIIPIYNVEHFLSQALDSVLNQFFDSMQILLVDDGSTDKSGKIADEYAERYTNVQVFHTENSGYAEACNLGLSKANGEYVSIIEPDDFVDRNMFAELYERAKKTNADIVIMVHPDYQYTPKLVPAMAAMLAFDEYDACIASRFIGKGALEGGMPLYKFIANKILTLFQNLMMGERLTEYHTGFRAFSREVLEKCPLKDCDDDFVFDNEMLALIFYKGYTIGQISCPTKYFPDASSINFMRSCKYGLGVLKTSILYKLAKTGIYKSKIFKNDAKTLDKNEELPYFQG